MLTNQTQATKSLAAKASENASKIIKQSIAKQSYSSEFSPVTKPVSITPAQTKTVTQPAATAEAKPDILADRKFDIEEPESYQEFCAMDPDIHESKLSSDHMYSLLSSPKAGNLDVLAKDPALPILCFTGYLYRQIRYITESIPNSEYAIFLMLRRIDERRPHFLAFDFFMPGQVASGAGVSLYPNECDRYFDMMRKAPYYQKNGLHRNICHLHSHASFGTFWSGTDNEQQLSRNDLGFMDDFRFYVVVDAKGDIKCSLVTYKPVLVRVEAATAISYAEPEYSQWLGNKRKAELSRMVDAYVVRPKPVVTAASNWYGYGKGYGGDWGWGEGNYGGSAWAGNIGSGKATDYKMLRDEELGSVCIDEAINESNLHSEYGPVEGVHSENEGYVGLINSTGIGTNTDEIGLEDSDADAVANTMNTMHSNLAGLDECEFAADGQHMRELMDSVMSHLPKCFAGLETQVTTVVRWMVSIVERAHSDAETDGICGSLKPGEVLQMAMYFAKYISALAYAMIYQVDPDSDPFSFPTTVLSETVLEILASPDGQLSSALDAIEDDIYTSEYTSIEETAD